MSRLEVTLTAVAVPLLLLFASPNLGLANSGIKKNQNGYGQTGTLQKMIVENASVTMQFDLNGLNGSNSLVARPVMLQFAAAPNSFFPILVFNDLLRGLEPGSMALIAEAGSSASAQATAGQTATGYTNLPAMLRASLKGSLFSTFKDYITTTTPLRSRLPSRMADCSSRKSLPTHWVARRMLDHRPEQSLPARRCNQSRSPRLRTENPRQRSCRRWQMVPEQTRRRRCQAQMSLLGTSKT
jgi:hypothetical protein